MTYQTQEAYLQGFTGVNIFYRKFIAPDAKRTIIIVHGLGEHSGRYMNVVNFFKNKNTNFYLIDNRGHGKSEGARGHILLFGHYLDDLRIFVEKVREEESEHDIFLLGHSMGGNIIANYLIQRDSFFTGAIFSAPGFRIAAKINPLKEAVGKIMSNVLPQLSLKNDLNTSHLSHDSQVVEEYENDPLVHDKVSARWFTQFLWAGNFAVENANAIRCPVLVMQGSEDLLIDPDGAKKFFQNLSVKKKELHLYQDFYHEIFNEVEKEKPLATMEKWVDERCADKDMHNLIVVPRPEKMAVS